jgi:hypothetical protein
MPPARLLRAAPQTTSCASSRATRPKRPQPTGAHVAQSFAAFLRQDLRSKGLVVLAHLELVFAYRIELNFLRTPAADDDRVLLLLPGRRDGRRVVMFRDLADGSYTLSTNLIADNHLWELRGWERV